MLGSLQIHPVIVHFPLALTIIGTLCLWIARWPKIGKVQGSLAAAGTWNFILGGITVLLTLVSGSIAAMSLDLHGAAQHSVSRHMIWAVCTSQLVVLLALWRGVGGDLSRVPSRLFLGLSVIACAGLVVTGYWGGENVYHYGIAVAPH